MLICHLHKMYEKEVVGLPAVAGVGRRGVGVGRGLGEEGRGGWGGVEVRMAVVPGRSRAKWESRQTRSVAEGRIDLVSDCMAGIMRNESSTTADP